MPTLRSKPFILGASAALVAIAALSSPDRAEGP